MQKKVKYFKNLDTLRALAAIIVVIGHVEFFKKNNSIPNLIESDFIIFPNGHLAVVLFFVLSGFLITYLLTIEKESGSISFKKFYVRRILRIWPLYYLIIFLSFILFNPKVSIYTILLSLGIFPNVAHAIGEGWPTSPQIWSIGVEEQFYLFWPLFILLVPEKRMIVTLIAFILIYTLLPHILGFINLRTINNEDFNTVMNRFFYGTKFNCMALGALFGYCVAKGKTQLNFFSKDIFVICTTTAVILLWFLRFELKYFTDEFFAVLFSLMIFGFSTNKKVNIDFRISKFLGKISYGIYMYHWIILLLIIKLIPYDNNQLTYNLTLYSLVLTLTVLTSWLSYNYFEKYFLDLKKKYTTK